MFCCLRNHECEGCASGNCKGTRQICRGDGFSYVVVGKSASSSIIEAIGNDCEFVPFQEVCSEEGFVFSFVRNPFNRLVSCWMGWTQRPESPLYRLSERFWYEMSIEDFVDSVCSIEDEMSDEHFVSQSTLLKNQDGELIPSFIGRVESIDEDWKVVMERTGLDHVGRKDQTLGWDSYEHIFSPEMREKVMERYAEDFEWWY